MGTITSANAKLTITVSGPAGAVVGPFTVQGFASDDAFSTDPVESGIARIGVDGRPSFGFVPFLTPQTITLQADSPSIPLFEAWLGAEQVLQEALIANGSLSLPSLQKSYALIKGGLTRITPIPPGKRVLEPVTYEITWGSVQPAPIAV